MAKANVVTQCDCFACLYPGRSELFWWENKNQADSFIVGADLGKTVHIHFTKKCEHFSCPVLVMLTQGYLCAPGFVASYQT